MAGPTERRTAFTGSGQVSEPRQNGRRWLTVAEVAPLVRGSEDYVRKLIAIQRKEDSDAHLETRAPCTIGIRARQQSPRKTLILEADVYDFLFRTPSNGLQRAL